MKYKEIHLGTVNGNKDVIYMSIETWEIIDKALKAVKIIKEKKVNLEYLKCCENYEQYKTICSYWNEITQKEYELLKEVLSND